MVGPYVQRSIHRLVIISQITDTLKQSKKIITIIIALNRYSAVWNVDPVLYNLMKYQKYVSKFRGIDVFYEVK